MRTWKILRVGESEACVSTHGETLFSNDGINELLVQ